MSEFKIDHLVNYTLEKKQRIDALSTTGYLLRHNKTQARVVVMENDDDNKVFNIAFRTPPNDNTGVAHILEHSILCGSEKYPVKNPFEELVQGSLNTFLNAMTYGDKTMYPLASCNMTDFKNLMDVYLDAVFHPNIYREKEIFMQEGWHYEIESKEDELSYNGVVYNEMKGIYSTPERVMDKYVSEAMWQDSCYGKDSGGVPENIPELTYEEFLDFHKKYYHPSNSYIYLYGNMDMEERLKYLDECYLSHYDRADIDSEIKVQPPLDAPVRIEGVYSIGEDEATEKKALMSYTSTAGMATDKELYYAFSVLSYVLAQMPGAPLKKAIVDSGIAKTLSSGYGKNVLQPTFEIVAKDADENKTDEFIQIIENTLNDIVKNGIDKKSLRGALNVMEFQYREADFGRFPKGLFYLLYIMDSWLYDDNEPFMHLDAINTFEVLNEKAEGDYFEELIKKYILDNNHKVICTLRPEKRYEKKQDEELADKLKSYKASLTDNELEKLIEETEKLKKYQSEPSPREDVEKIPLIELEDIDKEPKLTKFDEREIKGVKVCHTNLKTNGIAYVTVSFDCKYVSQELLPYLGLLEAIYTDMDTENYSYAELNNEINNHSGGFYASVNIYNSSKNYKRCQVRFEGRIKVLYKEMAFVPKLFREVFLHTKYKDKKRLREIIEENVPAIRNSIISGGDAAALYRAFSHISEIGYMNDRFSGIGAYEFFRKLEKELETDDGTFFDEIIQNMEKVIALIYDRKNLVISVTSDNEGYKLFEESIGEFIEALKNDTQGNERQPVELYMKNEAIVIPSPVSYSVMAGNYKMAGYEYNGTMKCLTNILDYGYLWQQVRVLGGAYGVMSVYQINSGNIAFRSYRDPNVKKTYEAYRSVAGYLKNYEADEREIKKIIIGTVSMLDTPRNPKAEGNFNMAMYITDKSPDEIAKERTQILSLREEDVRNAGEIIEKAFENPCLCTVGNKEKIMEVKEMFDEIKEIF